MPLNRIEVLAKIAAYQAMLAGMPDRPAEPTWASDKFHSVTVRFRLFVDESDSTPVFRAAIRVDGYWNVTGLTGPAKKTWAQLWDWIESQGGLAAGTFMQFATGWEEIQ